MACSQEVRNGRNNYRWVDTGHVQVWYEDSGGSAVKVQRLNWARLAYHGPTACLSGTPKWSKWAHCLPVWHSKVVVTGLYRRLQRIEKLAGFLGERA